MVNMVEMSPMPSSGETARPEPVRSASDGLIPFSLVISQVIKSDQSGEGVGGTRGDKDLGSGREDVAAPVVAAAAAIGAAAAGLPGVSSAPAAGGFGTVAEGVSQTVVVSGTASQLQIQAVAYSSPNMVPIADMSGAGPAPRSGEAPSTPASSPGTASEAQTPVTAGLADAIRGLQRGPTGTGDPAGQGSQLAEAGTAVQTLSVWPQVVSDTTEPKRAAGMPGGEAVQMGNESRGGLPINGPTINGLLQTGPDESVTQPSVPAKSTAELEASDTHTPAVEPGGSDAAQVRYRGDTAAAARIITAQAVSGIPDGTKLTAAELPVADTMAKPTSRQSDAGGEMGGGARLTETKSGTAIPAPLAKENGQLAEIAEPGREPADATETGETKCQEPSGNKPDGREVKSGNSAIDRDVGAKPGTGQEKRVGSTETEVEEPGVMSRLSTDGVTQGSQAANPDRARIEHIRPQPEAPQWKPVFDQIVDRASLSFRNGLSEISVHLRPEVLGKVSLHVTVQDGRVSASITADNAQVRALIESNLTDLRQSLADQGLQLGHLEVGVGGNRFRDDGRSARHGGTGSSSREIPTLSNEGLPQTVNTAAYGLMRQGHTIDFLA